jgi:hypothetical protein
MTDTEREQLKKNLRDMVAGSSDGIDLDTPFNWVVEGIDQPDPFFANLESLIPPDAILYFESSQIAPEVATFYESHRAHNAVAVARDTLFPEPDTYHVAFCPGVVAFHDSFDGWLVISEHINEPVITEFCRKLGVTYRREQAKKRDPEALRAFLKALEHPDQVRILNEPLWKRLWREFVAGWKEG